MNLKKAIITGFLLAAAQIAIALPPAVEFDKLSLEAKNALQAKDFARAESALNKLRDFDFKLPESYWYLLGTTQIGLEKYKSAAVSFEKYLNIFGNQGKFYKESLEGLTSSERLYADAIKRQATEQSNYEQRLESCINDRVDDCGWKCGNRPNSGASKEKIGKCMLEKCGFAPKWTEVWGNTDQEKGEEYVKRVCRETYPAPVKKSFE